MARRHEVDEHYVSDADSMYAALWKIARYPDFPPSQWPTGTDPEHMWNEMVTIARVCLCGVDLMQRRQKLQREGCDLGPGWGLEVAGVTRPTRRRYQRRLYCRK